MILLAYKAIVTAKRPGSNNAFRAFSENRHEGEIHVSTCILLVAASESTCFRCGCLPELERSNGRYVPSKVHQQDRPLQRTRAHSKHRRRRRRIAVEAQPARRDSRNRVRQMELFRERRRQHCAGDCREEPLRPQVPEDRSRWRAAGQLVESSRVPISAS